MRWTTSRLLMVGGLMVILFGVGCSPSSTPPTATTAPSVHVAVALDWVHDSDYSAFYLAQDQGLYAAANLDVDVLPYEGVTPIDMVLEGHAEFGTSSADVLLQERAKGKPVVAIATIFQRNPLGFASLADRQIMRPQDLIGKRILLDPLGTSPIMLKTILGSQGIDIDQVTVIERTDYSNDALINGEVDVIDVYVHNQPIELEHQGHPVNVMLSADYGAEVYAITLFTTDEMIQTKPEVVQAFITTTIQGLQAVVGDPDGALSHVLSRDPSFDSEVEGESLQRAIPLINIPGSHPGMMRAADWETAYEILRDQGLITQTLDVSQAYTLRFLDQAYHP